MQVRRPSISAQEEMETSTRADLHEADLHEIESLHRRCGVYTKPDVVRRILDAVGWRENVNLSQSRLLEPAAGDGAFLVEAAQRLIGSLRRNGIKVESRALRDRIRAFELHPREASSARARVRDVLRALGVHPATADACARSWIVTSDFLLTDLPSASFTHAVGNPPYVRWSKIPSDLKARYNRRLPRDLTGGDLFIPFLDASLRLLQPGGRCGFICSDRWRYMAFAEGFRDRWVPRLDISSEDRIASSEAFERDVDSYVTVFIGTKRAAAKPSSDLTPARHGTTLIESGCEIRVGPALGHTPAFVLGTDEADVEPELLCPWVEASEISEGEVKWEGRRVIALHRSDGSLIDLEAFPLLRARLQRHREALGKRSIVQKGAPWYRTIDRVRIGDWRRPKLLIPELAKIPRLAIDRSGAVPSHGVYAIFAPNDDVDALYEKLRDGGLARALDGIAPRVKGNYVRCYARFLSMMRLA